MLLVFLRKSIFILMIFWSGCMILNKLSLLSLLIFSSIISISVSQTFAQTPDNIKKKLASGNSEKPNGCGADGGIKVPNIPSANFTSACNSHDICYSTCGKERAQCDQQFRTDLIAACYDYSQTFKYNPIHQERMHNKCIPAVEVYHRAVQIAGREAYDAAQAKSCSGGGVTSSW